MRRKLLNFKRSSNSEDASATEYGVPIDVTDGGSDAPEASDAAAHVVETGSVFDSVLSQELLAPSVATAEPPPAPTDALAPASVSARSQLSTAAPVVDATPSLDNVIAESPLERNRLRAEMTHGADSPEQLTNRLPQGAEVGALSVDQLFDATDATDATDAPAPCPLGSPSAFAFPELSFWERYDEATASAELFAVPPAAITAIVGALHVAAPVAERCRASHWVSECDVYVLTSRPELVEDPSWKLLKRPSDVVALLDDGLSDFPLIVVDIPRELPSWIRPLTSRLRDGGVGLVRYVLDDDPSDEDLATWHGELGRPSVLDLVAAVPPARVLDLLDRGEPVASVGGMPITADLLMALRLSV